MKLEWVPTNMVGGKKWYLYGMTPHTDSQGISYHRKGVVMYLSAHHKVCPGKPRRFIGWDVYQITSKAPNAYARDTYSTKVGPRIFRLKKAQDFAEMIWRMG